MDAAGPPPTDAVPPTTPASEDRADRLTILSGTGQNVAGLVVALLATFGSQVLITRSLGAAAYGVVYVGTQVAFVGAAATRFGMDVAAVRRVAIDVGKGDPGRARAVVSRAAAIATVASVVSAVALYLAAPALAGSGGIPANAVGVFRAAALALPFVALAQVYLGGTRGLKIMSHTLSIYWAGQPLAWIALMAAGFAFRPTETTGVLAYAGSWILATLAALWAWRHETRAFGHLPPAAGETADLLRYGTPRAPASLFAQLLFVADLFVLARYAPASEYGVYAAAVRVGQVVVLFLISVNLVFSPFVADLHARGRHDRLNDLFKAVTRWTFAATLPVILTLSVLAEPVLRLFGGEFATAGARTALTVLIAGQAVNVAVGSVGFILIMVGRTGWDLVVYTASIALDLALAFWLAPRYGMEGAAVAQAVTLVASNALRLYLVWRFLRIQPFSRDYARLALPAIAGALAMIAVHLPLADGPWPVDLLVSAFAGTLAYTAALIVFGLAPEERAAAGRLLRNLRAGGLRTR
ncbi:MAG TPA: polysaccharide biosynthesis C-terminal domain-containing protein [Actinomycetota bacterium]|nr:polysaccharide biosynthesis C-terminal domain-containing protein [Actinomycetota bacterium]